MFLYLKEDMFSHVNSQDIMYIWNALKGKRPRQKKNIWMPKKKPS